MTETQAPTIIDAKPYISFAVVDLREYDFNEYVAWRRYNPYQAEREGEPPTVVVPINGLREAFHNSLPDHVHRWRYTLRFWHERWEWFLSTHDARDKADTQAESLGTLF